MQNNDFRAKQFLPFDSLAGFSDAIKMASFSKNNNIFENLKVGDFIRIKYYNNLDYIETCGKIKKIDSENKVIYLLKTKISFENIIDIF